MAHTEDADLDALTRNGSPERARPGRIPEIIVFGPYRLLAKPRRLERAGSSVPLGDRAFEILRVLTERAGEIVTHSELMARVWGKVVVGEGSLRFHINALRKTLAQDGTQTQYIRNVPRRGYVFTAAVRAGMDSAEAADSFVTVVHIGGVGKTTVVLLFDSCQRVTEAAAIIGGADTRGQTLFAR